MGGHINRTRLGSTVGPSQIWEGPTVLINIGYRRMATFMMYISQEGLMSVFVRQDKLCGYGQTR